MSVRYKTGFTIVETMLFLAISGLMMAGLLVGVGSAISSQRYKDGVTSFQGLVQQQYSNILNTHNDRDKLACDTSAVTSTTAANQTARGRSNCIIAGRYLLARGEEVKTYDVLGYYAGDAPGTIAEMRSNLTLKLYDDSLRVNLMEWGTRIAWPTAGIDVPATPSSTRTVAVLIVRSPANGFAYTFTANYNAATAAASGGVSGLNTIVRASNHSAERVICVTPNGLFTGTNLAVVIQPYASGTAAVTIRSNDTAGDGQRC